jgi:hypothetical protein
MVTFRLIEEDEQRIVYWYFRREKRIKGMASSSSIRFRKR